MTDTTAKIKLTGKTENNDQVMLTFNADYDDERNKAWARYTPALSLTMTVIPEVADRFETGSTFLLTFEQE